MHSSQARRAPLLLKIAVGLVMLFLAFPAAIIVLYGFTTEDRLQTFPPPGLTLDWFPATLNRPDLWDALSLSLGLAVISTILATILGLLAASAVNRMKFGGKDAVAFLMVLPIALPGIVTGIALSSSMNVLNIDKNFWTIVAGHVTFCIVTVYNNVIARYRRMGNSQIEASMDLGASGFETFRHIILPGLATSLLAGALLAFALSLDEIIVTKLLAGSQTTLPVWIYAQLSNRPRNRPITNVVAIFVLAITFIPVALAHRWSERTSSEQ
jgi:putative spermidine/putrescine transport system permease protein